MSKSKISIIAQSIKTSIYKHSPEILTGIGIAGMVTTTILAVKATPKALILINEKKEEKNVDKLDIFDTVKATWTCYIPSVITGGLSVICIIGANSVNLRRNAALAAAYSLSESTLKDYQEKVIEAVGDKKEKTIRESAAKEKLNRNPLGNSEVIMTGTGETLCYDVVSGRYFKSDIEKIRRVENDLNREMRDEMYVSLNEFYSEIGLDTIKLGDELGWNIDRGYITIDFSAQLADNGQPCLVLDYTIAPMYDYKI